jgi:hypothetical protein
VANIGNEVHVIRLESRGLAPALFAAGCVVRSSLGTPIVATAAIHAGMLSNDGGEASIVLEPGRRAYRGSRRQGIESSDYGNYGSSCRFAR